VTWRERCAGAVVLVVLGAVLVTGAVLLGLAVVGR
jgi:hypothetical protein